MGEILANPFPIHRSICRSSTEKRIRFGKRETIDHRKNQGEIIEKVKAKYFYLPSTEDNNVNCEGGKTKIIFKGTNNGGNPIMSARLHLI